MSSIGVPAHVGPPYFGLADLAAELEARGLLHLLDEQLTKPTIGHPIYRARRAACRVRWAESALAVARLRAADLEPREVAS